MVLLQLFDNQTDLGLLLLRLGVGIIFLIHGRSKLNMWKMQPSEQMPAGMLNLMKFLGVAETLGGISVIFGFLTQFSTLGFVVIMTGAILMKRSQWHVGFTADNTTGWEFDFSLLVAAILLFFVGGGAFSLDAIIF